MAKLKENSTIVKVSGEELIATEPKVLSMIQENAYVHPATHPASMITGLHDSAITGVAGSVAWDNVTGKPSTFEPSSHTHTASQVGLGNVQNYGIATKAQAEAGTANDVYMTPLRVANALSLIEDRLFPRGGIIMWSGSINNIPAGWALCDGSNGTPDLRDRFIVGAGGDYNVGDKGGANSVTLNINQMPSHDHGSGDLATTTDGSHSHTYIRPTGGMSAAEGDWDIYRGADPENTSSDGSHSHSVTGYTSYTGGDQPHENRPPYYALAYIMKL